MPLPQVKHRSRLLALAVVAGSGSTLVRAAAQAQPAAPTRLALSPLRLSQPLVLAGQPVELRLHVANPGTAAVTGLTASAELSADLSVDPPSPDARTLAAGASTEFRWTVRADHSGVYPVHVHLHGPDGADQQRSLSLVVLAGSPQPDTYEEVHPQVNADRHGNFVFRNRHLVAVVPHLEGGFSPVIFYPASRTAQPPSRPSAIAPALATLTWREGEQMHEGTFVATSARTRGSDHLELTGAVKDGSTSWEAQADLEIGSSSWISWTVRVKPSAAVRLGRFSAMPLRVGAAGPREAIFPGLEYLEGDEVSTGAVDDHTPAHTRLVPDPYHVTIPLMSLSQTGATTALLWDNHQAWGGVGYPAALFDSPNRSEGQDNHRMEVFLPPVPQNVHENEEEAAAPLPVAALQELRLSGRVCVLRDTVDPTRAIRQWASAYGTPRAEPPPRTLDAERALCREAYTRSAWDAQARGWRRVTGPTPTEAQTSAFPTLALLLDADRTSNAALRGQLQAQATSVLDVLRKRGPLDPRLAYRSDGAVASVDAEGERVHALIRTQLANGAWAWDPAAAEQKSLGEPGTLDVGTITARVLRILRYAVLTGDSSAAGSGRRALEYIDRLYRVPRAGQTRDLPLHAPDLVAATQAAESFLLGYQISGEERFFTSARYWADTGLPFIYLWGEKERPALKHAALPAFGAANYSGPWRGVASATRGLAFARVLRQLARVRPDDLYETISEGILSSAMRQQAASGSNAGLLPEFWKVRENQAAGNNLIPDPLLAVLYQRQGLDTDVSHVRARVGPDRLFVASGATITDTETTAMRLRLNLHWIEGNDTFTTVSGVLARPISVQYNSRVIPVLGHPLRRTFLPEATSETERGWYYDPDAELLILRLPHNGGEDHLEIRWPDSRQRTPIDREDIRIKPLK